MEGPHLLELRIHLDMFYHVGTHCYSERAISLGEGLVSNARGATATVRERDHLGECLVSSGELF